MSIEEKVTRFLRRALFLVLTFLIVVGSCETFLAYRAAKPHLPTMYEALSRLQWIVADLIMTLIMILLFTALLMFSNRNLTFNAILKGIIVAILLAPILLIEIPLSVVENQYFGLDVWIASLLFLLLLGLFIKDLGLTLYTEIRRARQRRSAMKGD